MVFGNQKQGAIQMYPDDSLQSLVSSWWLKEESQAIKRGRLLKAFVPHVDQNPMTLVPEGRKDPTSHTQVNYKLEPLQIKQIPKPPTLPVAALPSYPGEIRTVYRAKKRPVLVISCGGPDIPKGLKVGAARWQTAPTLLVAPYYGATQSGTRGGWREEFVKRIRRCEYPQYLWDMLPINGSAEESILRLDHVQPIARNPDTYELTQFRMSEEAITVLDEWLSWLFTEKLSEKGVLLEVRKGLMGL